MELTCGKSTASSSAGIDFSLELYLFPKILFIPLNGISSCFENGLCFSNLCKTGKASVSMEEAVASYTQHNIPEFTSRVPFGDI